MTHDFLPALCLLALALVLIRAVVTDLARRTISNRLNITVALMAPLYWASIGLPLWPGVAIQIGLGVAVFGLFAILFAIGMMGGGDVKLLAALALWLPFGALGWLLVLMAMLGGVVTVVAIVHHGATRRIGRVEVPYGVAIALAALWVVGEPYFNPFA
ncbi:MAG: prepilin peptidase [Sphingobium sp.]